MTDNRHDGQATVTVYRTSTCPYCVMAAEFLDELGVAYSEISLDDHPDRQAATSAILADHYTVPLVVIGERAIGGLDRLRELRASGELQTLIDLD